MLPTESWLAGCALQQTMSTMGLCTIGMAPRLTVLSLRALSCCSHSSHQAAAKLQHPAALTNCHQWEFEAAEQTISPPWTRTILLVDEGTEGLRIGPVQKGANAAREYVSHNQGPLEANPFPGTVPLQPLRCSSIVLSA